MLLYSDKCFNQIQTSSEPVFASLFSLLAGFVVNFSNLFWTSYIYAFKCSSLPRKIHWGHINISKHKSTQGWRWLAGCPTLSVTCFIQLEQHSSRPITFQGTCAVWFVQVAQKPANHFTLQTVSKHGSPMGASIRFDFFGCQLA